MNTDQKKSLGIASLHSHEFSDSCLPGFLMIILSDWLRLLRDNPVHPVHPCSNFLPRIRSKNGTAGASLSLAKQPAQNIHVTTAWPV
jgi:hypothetical protein